MIKTLFLILFVCSTNLVEAEDTPVPETSIEHQTSDLELRNDAIYLELAGGEADNHGFLMAGIFKGYHSPSIFGFYARFGISLSLRDEADLIYIFKNFEGSFGIKYGGPITGFVGLGGLNGENAICNTNDTSSTDKTCSKETDFAVYPEVGFSVKINDSSSLGLTIRQYRYDNSYQYNTITITFGNKFP